MNENITRSLSGIFFMLVLISATLYSKTSFLLIFGFFLLQSIYEFSKLQNLPILKSILLGVFLYILFAIFTNYSFLFDIGLLFSTLFVSIQLMTGLFYNSNIYRDIQSKWVLLIGYIILPFVLITKLAFIHFFFNSTIIVALFILIWTNDTFAYITGKLFGKNKLFEKISPKKTIEGFIGGTIFTIFCGIIISLYYIKKDLYIWIVIAIIVSFFGTFGDLIESKFKRMANVKDSGNIMPGHGGLLDRLDSVIFVTPFVYLFYKIIIYVS